MTKAEERGYDTGFWDFQTENETTNPYEEGSDLSDEWLRGYKTAIANMENEYGEDR